MLTRQNLRSSNSEILISALFPSLTYHPKPGPAHQILIADLNLCTQCKVGDEIRNNQASDLSLVLLEGT